MVKKLKINDILALLILIFIIPGIWLLTGWEIITLPGEIIGATIMAWGLVLQYYFRRKPPDVKGDAPHG